MPKTKRAKDKNAAARREFEKFLRSGGETFFISGGLLMLSKSAEPLQVIAELLQLLVAPSEGATLAAPQRTTAPLVDGGEVARGDEMRRSIPDHGSR